MPRAKEPSTGRMIPGPMAQMPYHLLRDRSVGAAAKLIYLALRHNEEPLGRQRRPWELPLITINSTYLLEDTGLGREEFRSGIAELEQQGWVAVMRPNEHKKTVIIDGQERTWRHDRAAGSRDPTRPYTAAPSTYMLLKG